MKNDSEYIIVHTAAKEGSDYDIEDIDRAHRQRGFRMVGYHYLIHKDGTIEQGRPDDLHGAHCRDGGMNTKSLGICFQGHGDISPLTREQKTYFEILAGRKLETYDIGRQQIHGHRKYANKRCPGNKVDMDDVRDLIHPDLPEECQVDAAPIEVPDVEMPDIPNSL